MNTASGAGSDGTGLGPLEGLIKDDVHEEIHEGNVTADDLAQRMAAMTVRRYAIKHKCGCTDPRHDEEMALLESLLDLLGLPREFQEPTSEEKATIRERLPRTVHMDSRAPDHLLSPEKRPYPR